MQINKYLLRFSCVFPSVLNNYSITRTVIIAKDTAPTCAYVNAPVLDVNGLVFCNLCVSQAGEWFIAGYPSKFRTRLVDASNRFGFVTISHVRKRNRCIWLTAKGVETRIWNIQRWVYRRAAASTRSRVIFVFRQRPTRNIWARSVL